MSADTIETTVGEPAADAIKDVDQDAVGADDNSWARPRPRASHTLITASILLTGLLFGIATFTMGVKIGKDRGRSEAAAGGGAGFGGLGRGAGGQGAGGLGGLGTQGTGGQGATAAATATTTVDAPATGAGLGGLLPGAAAPGSASEPTAATQSTETTVAPLGGLLPGADAAAAAPGASPEAAVQAGDSPGATGRIVRVDGSTIVVRTLAGEEVTITAADDTSVRRTESSSFAALTPGAFVSAIGDVGADGTVTARQITVGEPAPSAPAAGNDAEK